MHKSTILTSMAALLIGAATASAAGISGEYLEARTCDVYTGPCFANAEMNLSGKEALMAWKVEEGAWNGVQLEGRCVALIVNAEGTLGDDGVFGMNAGHVDSVILVDRSATPAQREALVAFVKSTAADLAGNVVAVHSAPITLQNNHLTGHGSFSAGDVARIETRGLSDGDCVCTNESVYYQPLNDVENSSPAYSLTLSYRGADLGNRWTHNNTRSAFLATFSY